MRHARSAPRRYGGISIAAAAAPLLLASLTASVSAQSPQPLAVTLSNPTSCSPMTVSWDGSKGQAPWTVTVAPLGHTPVSVELGPEYSGGSDQWTWSWNVPSYGSASVQQLIVAVSDAQGRYSGSSAIVPIASGSSSCVAAPTEQLDFVWYPPASAPRQCSRWRLSFEEDRGNLGLEPPVDFLIIPENQIPTRLRVGGSSSRHIDWTVNYASGTRFAVVGFDRGRSGSGGVGGSSYRVDAGLRSTCLARDQREVLPGLPNASTTLRQAIATTSAASASTSRTRMATERASSTSTAGSAGPTAKSATADSDDDDQGQDEGSPSAGKIGGVVGGVLAAIAAVIGLVLAFVYYRRKQRGEDRGEHSEKEARGTTRWSAGGPGNVVPFTSGRRSPWRHSAMVVGPQRRNLDNGPLVWRGPDFADSGNAAGSEMGHGSSSSISLHRSRDSYGGGGATSTLSHAPTVHSTVPDDALFPPPRPMHQLAEWPPSPSQSRAQSRTTEQDTFESHSTRRHPFSRESMAALQGLPLSPSSYHDRSLDRVPAPRRNLPNPFQEASPQRGETRLHGDAESASPSAVTASLASVRIPPPSPATTSLFDPYVHMSQLYSTDDVARISALLHRGTPTPPVPSIPASLLPRGSPLMSSSPVVPSSPRYADPEEGAARLRVLDDQLKQERQRVISTVSLASDAGLPYDRI